MKFCCRGFRVAETADEVYEQVRHAFEALSPEEREAGRRDYFRLSVLSAPNLPVTEIREMLYGSPERGEPLSYTEAERAQKTTVEERDLGLLYLELDKDPSLSFRKALADFALSIEDLDAFEGRMETLIAVGTGKQKGTAASPLPPSAETPKSKPSHPIVLE